MDERISMHNKTANFQTLEWAELVSVVLWASVTTRSLRILLTPASTFLISNRTARRVKKRINALKEIIASKNSKISSLLYKFALVFSILKGKFTSLKCLRQYHICENIYICVRVNYLCDNSILEPIQVGIAKFTHHKMRSAFQSTVFNPLNRLYYSDLFMNEKFIRKIAHFALWKDNMND